MPKSRKSNARGNSGSRKPNQVSKQQELPPDRRCNETADSTVSAEAGTEVDVLLTIKSAIESQVLAIEESKKIFRIAVDECKSGINFLKKDNEKLTQATSAMEDTYVQLASDDYSNEAAQQLFEELNMELYALESKLAHDDASLKALFELKLVLKRGYDKYVEIECENSQLWEFKQISDILLSEISSSTCQEGPIPTPTSLPDNNLDGVAQQPTCVFHVSN